MVLVTTAINWVLARFSKLAIVALVGTCCFLEPAAATPRSAGVWKANYRAPGGVSIPIYLDLVHAGKGREVGPIQGRVRMTWGFEPIRRSRLRKGGFTLEMGTPLLPLSVDARWSGKALALTIRDPRTAPVNILARRVAGLPQPPKRLPLPALEPIAPSATVATPPMGWNSWNRFNESIDDAAVRATADAMVTSGLREAGYRYVVIDDTWQTRGSDGKLRGNSKFPDMKALIKYVHSKGLLFGLYSSPGPTTCGGYPGSYGYEEDDARTFADWGVDYLKYDWCSAHEIYGEHEMRAVYQKMGAALRATGRPIVYSICQYGLADVTSWGPLVGGNLWRTVGDIQNSWASVRKSVETNLPALSTVRANAWADPDMLEIGNGALTLDESRAHMSFWVLAAAPLILGNDLRSMSEPIRAILTNPAVLDIAKDRGANAGKIIRRAGAIEVWRRDLADGDTVFGVFNLGQTPMSYRFDLHDKPQSTNHGFTDVWNDQPLKIPNSQMITIAAHGVLLLRREHNGPVETRN